MRAGDQAARGVHEGHRRRENFGVVHQTFEKIFAARTAAMETRFRRERIESRDMGAHHRRVTGEARSDIGRPDDASPLAHERAIGKARIVAELDAFGAELVFRQFARAVSSPKAGADEP